MQAHIDATNNSDDSIKISKNSKDVAVPSLTSDDTSKSKDDAPVVFVEMKDNYFDLADGNRQMAPFFRRVGFCLEARDCGNFLTKPEELEVDGVYAVRQSIVGYNMSSKADKDNEACHVCKLVGIPPENTKKQQAFYKFVPMTMNESSWKCYWVPIDSIFKQKCVRFTQDMGAIASFQTGNDDTYDELFEPEEIVGSKYKSKENLVLFVNYKGHGGRKEWLRCEEPWSYLLGSAHLVAKYYAEKHILSEINVTSVAKVMKMKQDNPTYQQFEKW